MSRTLSEVVRFVVLHHTGVADPHFDLMYEQHPGSALTTWRIPEWPPEQYVPATPLAEHRRDYLDYEGPVSNNRGSVKRVAAGTCRIEALLRKKQPYHIELWCEDDDPFVMLERYEDGWTAVPLWKARERYAAK